MLLFLGLETVSMRFLNVSFSSPSRDSNILVSSRLLSLTYNPAVHRVVNDQVLRIWYRLILLQRHCIRMKRALCVNAKLPYTCGSINITRQRRTQCWTHHFTNSRQTIITHMSCCTHSIARLQHYIKTVHCLSNAIHWMGQNIKSLVSVCVCVVWCVRTGFGAEYLENG